MTTNVGDKKIVVPFGAAPKSETFGDFHDGTVVSISGDRLVMASPESKEYSFRVATDAYVCCDGTICPAEDLKVGSRIRVTTKADDINVATKIESLVNQVDFADLD
jgi:hypothetical protein